VNSALPDGLAGGGPEVAALAAAPAPDGLLYRRRNNSIPNSSPRYKLKAVGEKYIHENLEWNDDLGMDEGTVDVVQDFQDREGRTWRQDADGLLELASRTSTSERKAVFQFRGNVEAFIRHFGRKHCAFWTVTDQDNLHPREFAKRWNSFRTNEGRFIISFIRVLEPQKNGRPHYHFLVAVAWDLEPEKFDWDAFKQANAAYRNGDHAGHVKWRAQYVASTPPQTRELWSRLRGVLPKYGLGRSEFLPIRKDGVQVGEHAGKYLEAGLKLRVHAWKGCRRVEYSRKHAGEWKKFGRQFSWFTPHAVQWRRRVRAIAKVVCARNLDELAIRLGKRWAYRLREQIINLDEVKFAEWVKNVGVYCSVGKPRPDPLKPPLWWLGANPNHPIARRHLEANPDLRQQIGERVRPGAGAAQAHATAPIHSITVTH
jgi:hypothetical protein